MADLEAIKSRLANIESVEPIISSMRTIAAGGWRQALRRQQATSQYVEHLSDVLGALLRQVDLNSIAHIALRPIPVRPTTSLILVIAAERGLCGSFNDTVLQGAQPLIAQERLRHSRVLLATLGSRAEAFFRARDQDLHLSEPLPVTRVASLELANDLASNLMAGYRGGSIDTISVIYSPYRAARVEPPVLRRWLPVDIEALPTQTAAWPGPIIETPPKELLERALDDWIHARFFQFVIESAASEQAARFRAMENASGNMKDMIAELTLSYHSARQNEITMQMLDLTAGSGILAGRRD